MQAIHYTGFGGTEVLTLADVPTPVLRHDQDVLIQVKAASINPLDLKIRQGFMQPVRPVQLPYVPGLDAAGVVVAVGPGVHSVQVGDEVLAATMGGAYAEYVVAQEPLVARKPATISFAEAAALVVNLGTAQSILFTEGHLAPGQRVLIQGAAGAVGATMVQLAKHAGLQVVATATGTGLDLVRQLGADEVIDYKTQAVTGLNGPVDLVADCAGGPAQADLFQVLKPGGKLLSIVSPPSPELARQYGVEARFVSSDLSARSLALGLQLVQEGKLRILVTRTFPLEEAARAQELVAAGGTHGKVVLTIG